MDTSEKYRISIHNIVNAGDYFCTGNPYTQHEVVTFELSKFGMPRAFRLVLFIEIIVLVGTAMAIRRDYQDSWILEGLEIPFVIFMVTNTLYFLTENNSKWLVLFATLSRFIIALLPNLKYEWFSGIALDQHQQFRAARYVCDNGYIESGRAYSETPIMHVFFAGYSEVTSVPLLQSFKYLPVFSTLLYPIITYSIIKKVFPEHKKSSLMKYALLLSSIPIQSNLSYLVTGTFFGSLLAFLFLSEFLKASKTNNRKHLVLAIIFAATLVMSHFISYSLLILGFLMVFLASKIFKIFQPNTFNLRFPIFLITLSSAWVMAQLINATRMGGAIELTLGNFVRGIMGIPPKFWSPTGVRLRFFELNLLDGVRILTVFHGGDIIVLLLAAFGIIVVAKKWHSSGPSKFLSVYFLSLWLFVPLQLLLTTGTASLVQYFRVIRHTLIICPMLGAFFLCYIDKRKHRAKPIIVMILLMTIALGTLETYGCQPFLPRSSAISKSLPFQEPIVFPGWSGVNSVYQRSMIQHIEKYASQEIMFASDAMTENQILGLADYEFSTNQSANYNPLLELADENISKRDYDIFLIHFPGKAGGLAEKAEIRTKKLILATILNSSILYTNQESYILIYPGLSNISTP